MSDNESSDEKSEKGNPKRKARPSGIVRRYSTDHDERKTPEELAEIFAQRGDFNSLVSMYAGGELDEFTEVGVRMWIARAYEKAAEERKRQAGQGKYPDVAWEDSELAELASTASSDWRQLAWEIRFNEQGARLEDQLAVHFPNLFGGEGGE